MNLGIAGRKAIVCASSQGLGYACAEALSMEGVEVILNGRSAPKLEAAASVLMKKTGVRVVPVAGDITTEQGRSALLSACPEPDILINNNAGPPPGRLEDWTPEDIRRVVESNMLSAIFLIQAVVRGMQERKFGRIVNITSALVTTPRPHLAMSSAARAGLTAFSKGISLETAKDNVTINQILPERIDSPRQIEMVERMTKMHGIDSSEARSRIERTVAAGRFGTTAEFGDACAFLCGANGGFISGQNLQLDGGTYPGLI